MSVNAASLPREWAFCEFCVARKERIDRKRRMYATIRLTPYIHIQGRVIRSLPDGAIAVDVSGREVIGAPVTALERKPEPAPQAAP
jgi:hypothetical protein